MTTRTKRLGAAIALFGFLLCLLPAFSMTLHDDDISELQQWHQYALNTMVVRYYTWNGSFSYSELAAVEKIFPIWLPTVAALAVWLVFLSTLIHLFIHDWTLALGASAFLLTTMILLMPTTPDISITGLAFTAREEAFYWQSALAKHTACAIAFTGYFWLALQQRLPKHLSITLCFTCAFFSAGFSEVSIALLPIILAIGPVRRRFAGLTGAGLEWAVIVLSPGNAIRAAAGLQAGGHPSGLVEALRLSIIAVPGYIKAYLPAWPMLALLVIAVVLFSRLLQSQKHLSRKDELVLIKCFVLLIGSIMLAFLPSYLAFSNAIPPRAYVIPQLVFVAALAVTGWTLGSVVRVPVAERRRNLTSDHMGIKIRNSDHMGIQARNDETF